MTDEICFTVPGQPPSWNHQYQQGRVGYRRTIFKSEAAVAYQDFVERACAKAIPPGWKPPQYRPKEGEGLLVVEFYFHLKQDIDCDNMMKALNDAIALGLGWHPYRTKHGKLLRKPNYDDRGFLSRAMYKITGVKEPFVKVAIR